jgi:hypothetical protein
MTTTINTAIDRATDPGPDSPAAGPASARRPRIAPVAYGILVLAVFFGAIGIAYATGAWQTTGRTAGEGRPALQGVSAVEVKGWMAVGEVADTFGVPYEELLAAFALPADTDPGAPLKELESDAFSVMALREWLAAEGYSTP